MFGRKEICPTIHICLPECSVGPSYIQNSLFHRKQISQISLCHQSYGCTSEHPSLKMQAMASYHFTGGKLYDRHVCGTADTTPQNRDEAWPPDSFSTHKHTERSSRGAQTHSYQLPLYHYWSTVTAPALSLSSLIMAEPQQEQYRRHISFDAASSGWKTWQDYSAMSIYLIPGFPSLEFSESWCFRLAPDSNRQPQVCIYIISGQWHYVMSALKRIIYKLNHKQLKSPTNLT